MRMALLAGISFPFRSEGKGLPASATGVEVIRADLIALLKTSKGSRVMRPNLGTSLKKLIFEDNTPVMKALIRREIVQTIQNEIPQVTIEDIQVKGDEKQILVNLLYSVQNILDQTGFIPLSGKASS